MALLHTGLETRALVILPRATALNHSGDEILAKFLAFPSTSTSMAIGAILLVPYGYWSDAAVSNPTLSSSLFSSKRIIMETPLLSMTEHCEIRGLLALSSFHPQLSRKVDILRVTAVDVSVSG